MPKDLGLEFAAKTDTGRVRAQNEDAIAISPAYGIAILADGMGGYNAGEVASRIAVETARQALEEGIERLRTQQNAPQSPDKLHGLLEDALQRANAVILEAAQNEARYQGMGTTMVVAVLHQDSITIAHVGDSRAYRLRHGELAQITRDHSLLQEQIDAGLIRPEMARFALNKNLVTRAVGVAAEMEVEVHDHRTEAGDIYLLCSDGLSDMLLPEEILDILSSRRASLEAVCEALVQRANDNGAHDNISVILIRVQSAAAESGGLLGRILGWMS